MEVGWHFHHSSDRAAAVASHPSMGCAALESGNLVEPVVGSNSLEAGELQMTVEAAAEHAERAQGPCSAEMTSLEHQCWGPCGC